MKFLLTVAAVIAVAVAGPTQRAFIVPGGAGPAPVIVPDFAPAPVVMPDSGPAPVIVPEPIAIGPAPIDSFVPIAIGPAMIDFPVSSPTSTNTLLVQIILNINQAAADASPIAVAPVAVPEPIEIVDAPASPVQVVDTAPIAPEPIIIGTPVLPSPAVVLPEELN